MKIVEYNHDYAQKVADMWNLSHDSWGGSSTVETAEEIIRSESKSGNIKLYLAIDQEEVVGYCSFSEYRYDTDTSYLPLLNVRPDYHGKGVGKILVQKVLQDAIASKYSRFDLFTWGGNIKAMPLYKKCGFMWEKKLDSVHLMNWIPYVMKTEALQHEMENIDYYRDLQREIDFEYDGEQVNGLTYYTYHWKNDRNNIRVQFERFGRGLRLIETPDYLIEMTTPDSKLIYGYEYPATFKIVNKSGKKLVVEINGKDDQGIRYHHSGTYSVQDVMTVKSTFTVEKTTEKQSEWITHPGVIANLCINGKQAVMKMGVNPIPPIAYKLNVPTEHHRIGKTYTAYLDIESGFNHPCEVQLHLKNTGIRFINPDIQRSLIAKEKQSIPVQYIVDEYEIYEEDIEYTVTHKDVASFTGHVQAIFKGYSNIMHARMEEMCYIVNGKNFVEFNIPTTSFSYGDASVRLGRFIMPMLGEPYSLEFGTLEPYAIDFEEIQHDIIMTVRYHSRDFEGVDVDLIATLRSSGIFEYRIALHNVNYAQDTIGLFHKFSTDLVGAHIPYNGHILNVGRSGLVGISEYDMDAFDENWLFLERDGKKLGICSDDENFHLMDYYLAFQYQFENFSKGATITSPTVYCSNVHPDHQSFRQFALAKKDVQYRAQVNQLHFVVNDGNLFVSDDLTLRVMNPSKLNESVTLRFNEAEQAFDDLNNALLSLPKDAIQQVSQVSLALKKQSFTEERLLFKLDGEMLQDRIQDHEVESLVVNNGVIEFRASADFGDAIYSLQYHGVEMLATTYPKQCSKSWWNDWLGGIALSMNRFNFSLRKQEERTCEFAQRTDNHGNVWQGIKCTTTIINNEQMRGYRIQSYTLTLPGVPLVATMSGLYQETGAYCSDEGIQTFVELNTDNRLAYVESYNGQNRRTQLNQNVYFAKGDVLQLAVNDFYLNQYSTNELYLETTKDMIFIGDHNRLNIPSGEQRFVQPLYHIFSDETIDPDVIRQLENIRFDMKE